MVNLVKDWEEMEAYASNASRAAARAYRVIQIELEGGKTKYVLRVQVGKFGFEKEFCEPNDQMLSSIVKYCTERKFLNVSKTVEDEDFFK